MKAVHRAVSRIRGVFDANGGDEALSREMQAHLEFATDEFIQRGMPPAEARRAALLEAKGIAQAHEAYRDQRGIPFVRAFARNLSFAWRGLTRNPSYALAILLSLALGIGLNTAIFTVADTVIRRPLPYPDAMNITIAGLLMERPGEPTPGVTWMPYNVLDTWRTSRTLQQVATFAPWQSVVQGDAGPEYVNGGAASSNLLEVLGVRPLMGRWFAANERLPYIVIGEKLWRRQFNHDPGILGRTLKVDGETRTIIGVLPRGIGLPVGAEFWTHDEGEVGAYIIARPVAGITDRGIRAELTTLTPSIESMKKFGYRVSVVTMPLHEQLFGPAKPTLRLLLAAAALFLLIACANVTNLVLARTLERRRELAVRAILGASTRSLAGLVTLENMLLAIGGGIIGVGIAYLATGVIATFAPSSIAIAGDLSMQGRPLWFAVGLVLGCCFLVSVSPAIDIARDRSIYRLTQSGAQAGRGRTMRRTRRALVVTQLALALVLMAGAGLLLRSVARLTRADHLGFSPKGVVILNLRPFYGAYPAAARDAFTARLVARVRAIPGVEDVATGPPPLVGGTGDGYREGFDMIFTYHRPGDPREKMLTMWAKYVNDRYVETFGIHLRGGRGLRRTDDSAALKVVMVNATAARLFFGNDDPVGRWLPATPLTGNQPGRAMVVGVVDDALQNDLAQEAKPEVLLPSAQRPAHMGDVNLAVKSSIPNGSMIGALERIVRDMDPTLAPSRLEAMSDVVDASLARHRFVLRLLLFFAGLGFALAVIGLYAVISYLVVQRTTEIGVRIALGAQYRHVIALVVGEGVVMAAAGILVGIPVTLAASRFLGGLLYEVHAWDLAVLGTGTGLLVVVALFASWAPARKAAGLDPAATLRGD